MSNIEEHNINKEDLIDIYDRVNLWINNCDSKASTILAIIGVAITIFFTNDNFNKIKEIIHFSLNSISFISILFLTTVFAMLFYLFKAVSNILQSLTATLDSEELDVKQLNGKSLIFYGSISKIDSALYYKNLLEKTDLKNDLISQIMINSKICTKKFYFYNLGLQNLKRCLFFTTITFLVYICYP